MKNNIKSLARDFADVVVDAQFFIYGFFFILAVGGVVSLFS